MKHAYRFLFSVFCYLIFPLGCSKDPEPEKTRKKILHLASNEDLFTFDPRKCPDRRTQAFHRLIFEGLTRLSPNGDPQLALAERVDLSEDKRTYIFYLKECYWSDQTPLTAYDFVYSWKQMLSPEFPSPNSHLFYDIKNAKKTKEGELPLESVGISAPSDRILVIELQHPTPYFLELVSSPDFYPIASHIDKTFPEWNRKGPFISNGAFIIDEWKFKRYLILEKNCHYWNAEKISLEGIHLQIIPDNWTCLFLYENEQLDWVGDPFTTIPPDAIPEMKKKNLLNVAPCLGSLMYAFNVEKAPFTNSKIRKALAYAIHRKALTQNLLQCNESPAFSVLQGSIHLHEEPLFKDADIAGAQKLFLEGLDELQLTLETFPQLTVTGTGRHLALIQEIKEQWRKAFGIDVKIQNLPWEVYLEMLYHRNFQIGILGWESCINDPIYNLSSFMYKSSKTNVSAWENREYRKLLLKAKKEIGEDARKEMLKLAEKLLLEHMPIIPLFNKTRAYLKRDSVKNIYYTPLGNPEFIYAEKTSEN